MHRRLALAWALADNDHWDLAAEMLAMEFPTEDALDKYLEDHPGADKRLHTVKDSGDGEQSDEKEDFAGDAPQGKKDAFKSFLKNKGAKWVNRFKNLPKNSKKLVFDQKYRKGVGTYMAKRLKDHAAHALDVVKKEAKEFKDAGKAIKKLAKGGKLDDHDKHAIKGVLKAVAMTVGGTLAMGGIGHLTAGALAQHFAAETAIKSVGKAALFASVVADDDQLTAWLRDTIIPGMVERFAELEQMSESDLLEILPGEDDA